LVLVRGAHRSKNPVQFRAELGEGEWRVDEARGIFEQVALGERFVEFLTLPAYDHLERG